MSKIFVVGSGPSLADTPMDEIKDDVFVMNNFGSIAKHFAWKIKPKYYLKWDHNTINMTYKEEIAWAVENCEHLYLWDRFKTGYPERHSLHFTMTTGVGELPNTTWFPKCRHSPYQANNIKAVQSWHLPEICTAFGGMSSMMQIAAVLGYTEIYLLGCDLGYTANVKKNHAIPDYTSDPLDKSEMDTRNMTAIHKMAKRSSPIPIYNASVGGELEIYERVDIRDVL